MERSEWKGRTNKAVEAELIVKSMKWTAAALEAAAAA